MSSNQVLDKITYPFPNFNGWKVEVWEWISYFTPHFLMDVITYPKPKGQCGREMDNLDYTLTKLDSRNIEGWPVMGDMQHPYRWAALSIPLEEARNFHSWKWVIVAGLKPFMQFIYSYPSGLFQQHGIVTGAIEIILKDLDQLTQCQNKKKKYEKKQKGWYSMRSITFLMSILRYRMAIHSAAFISHEPELMNWLSFALLL